MGVHDSLGTTGGPGRKWDGEHRVLIVSMAMQAGPTMEVGYPSMFQPLLDGLVIWSSVGIRILNSQLYVRGLC